MKPGGRRTIRIIIVLILAGLLAIWANVRPVHRETVSAAEMKDGIRAVIMMDQSIYSKNSRGIGFNYELLGQFSDVIDIPVKVIQSSPKAECWKELLSGGYTILVMSVDDSIPEYYRRETMASVPIRDRYKWVVSSENPSLRYWIDKFITEFSTDITFRQMVYRHFVSSQIAPYSAGSLRDGVLSPYDDIIKKYSKFIGVDWRLVAAMVYEESHFNIASTSSKDARGLMQLRESTARKYVDGDLYDPELNVKAGTLYFAELLGYFRKEKDIDDTNVIKFALASYNAGYGRISECRQVAESLGLDKNDWEEVTKAFEHMPNFVGKQTMAYIRNIFGRYETYRDAIPDNDQQQTNTN